MNPQSFVLAPQSAFPVAEFGLTISDIRYKLSETYREPTVAVHNLKVQIAQAVKVNSERIGNIRFGTDFVVDRKNAADFVAAGIRTSGHSKSLGIDMQAYLFRDDLILDTWCCLGNFGDAFASLDLLRVSVPLGSRESSTKTTQSSTTNPFCSFGRSFFDL